MRNERDRADARPITCETLAERPALFWFRDDLRLADNAALAAAHASGQPLVLAFIFDEESPGARPLGGAAKWWLDKSLRALAGRIAERGGDLVLRRGAAEAEIAKLVKESGADTVVWNRRYGPARKIDERIKTRLKQEGVAVKSYAGALLAEPFEMTTASGEGYKVFTPFWKALQAGYQAGDPHPEPRKLKCARGLASDDIDDWMLHPKAPDWSGGLTQAWTPGESGARKQLRDFLDGPIDGYASGRDLPDRDGTSRLSPHLHFGEISPAQVWRAARHAEDAGGAPGRDISKFLSELAWRDFSAHLLFHDPEMGRLSWRRKFDDVEWRKSARSELDAWRRGKTGYPIVDAGMRQLWTTGWMHNRVRMIVGSFLTKDLLVHWREGEAWFWDTLVDADEANNANGWQWVAGSGADAAPYFRVFNPVLQGEKFDPEGDYVRHWVPELSHLSAKHIHHPWTADEDALAEAGVTLGDTYPRPIVDHAAARKRALDAYAAGAKSPSLERRAS
ncbi:MAG: deoxyribodipyrimidine photo-lyase [Alphaproteobacteria bacterium]|nr:deoxyribodipyrimidine photo-lyase [Alphaproteobacteria bacterium]